MLACVDVHYDRGGGTAAIVSFADWGSAEPVHQRLVRVDRVEPYEPGAFYKRELPCLLAALESLEAIAEPPEVVIVDGLVWLGPDRPGLGARLHQAAPRLRTVVGVAKTPFRGAPASAVQRGRSAAPLWVDEVGDPVNAPERIREMHGAFRVPTMLRLVDQLCRGRVAVRQRPS